MTENQSPWLSTKNPPKQNPNSKRYKMAKGPLSRQQPPLQMTSGHGNFLSRLTQNSPPPVQLKLARKQSTLMDFFGSSGKNSRLPDGLLQMKRSLAFGNVKESKGTATDDPRHIPVAKKNQHQHSHDIRLVSDSPLEKPTYPLQPSSEVVTVIESNDSSGMLTQKNNHCSISLSESKPSTVSIHSRTSPLREIQVTDLMEPSSCSPASSYTQFHHGELYSPHCSPGQSSFVGALRLLSPNNDNQSESLLFETSDQSSYPQKKPAAKYLKYSLETDSMNSQTLSAKANQRAEDTAEQTLDFSASYDIGKTARPTNHFMCILGNDTDNKLKTQPSFNSEILAGLDVCHRGPKTQVHDLSSENDSFCDSELNMNASKKGRNLSSYPDKKSTDSDVSPNVFVSARTESSSAGTIKGNCVRVQTESENTEYHQTDNNRVEADNCDTFDLDSQVLYQSEDSVPSDSADQTNLNTESQTPSFTQDSQSLRFSESSNFEETGGAGFLSSSTLDEICDDKAGRLQYLKAKHMKEMETLTFTQSQTFSL
ncbi:hypothetical protein ElyMa_005158100 [Elysia marginata]|uniref:Uncharacterized protein n=1 Tax=Elysia marginata TaxID=1093978 RepID=A0AAV4JNX9_9GAST|nr:hypothetical protein ElyMa_005158100 [Elysia marginata]